MMNLPQPSPIKRLFFGLEAHAPWPPHLPKGRHLAEEDRHVTLAFLGEVDGDNLLKKLNFFPPPPETLGFGGIATRLLFLPPRRPRVVSWEIGFGPRQASLETLRRHLIDWLVKEGFTPRDIHRPFLAHLTLARAPFDGRGWEKRFVPLPISFTALHLYESLGNSRYRPIWSLPLLAPFEELEHTADLAFTLRGNNFAELYHHGLLALATHFPPLLKYGEVDLKTLNDLPSVIQALNAAVSRADTEEGAPFKAVSYHGDLKGSKPYTWEMIVDV